MLAPTPDGADFEEALSACGYIYRNGCRTAEEFEALFGFHPTKYPRYFTLTSYGNVLITLTYRGIVEGHFAQVNDNWGRLGIKNG